MVEKRREIILLAGMHRSGTSALARVLNLCGARIPGSLLPPSVHNPRGYWETEEVVEINNRALQSVGLNWTTIGELGADWNCSLEGKAFLAEARRFATNLEDHDGAWLIKDPRISLLASGWRQAFEEAGFLVKVVIAYRDPKEVAQSLASRQLIYSPHEAWPPERVYAIWLNYLLSLENLSRGLPRSFVDYGVFLTSWRQELARISLDLDLQDGLDQEGAEAEIDLFLSRDLKRANSTGENGGIVGETLALLNEALHNPNGLHRRFDAVRGAFCESRDLFSAMMLELQRKNEALAGAGLRPGFGPASGPPVRPSAPAETDETLHLRHQALLAAHGQVVADAAREREEAAASIRRLRLQTAAAETQLREEAAAVLERLKFHDVATQAQVRALEEERAALESRLEAREKQAVDDLHRAASAAAKTLEAERVFQLTEAAVQTSRLREQIAASELAARRAAEERWRMEGAALRVEHDAALTALVEQLQVERTALDAAVQALDEARRETTELRRELQGQMSAAEAGRQVEAVARQKAVGDLDAILHSKSWRFTRPLRGLRRQLGLRPA